MQPRCSRLTGLLMASLLTLLLLLLAPLVSFAGTHKPDYAGYSQHVTQAAHPPRSVGAVHFQAGDGSPLWSHAHYVYVNNDAPSNSISGFKLTQSGMTPLPGSPYATGGSGAGFDYSGNELAISPDHKCLFAGDDFSGTFNAFLINADGSLKLVTHTQVEARFPESVVVSPKGDVVFLVIYNYNTNPSLIDSFNVNANCAIKEAHSINAGHILASAAISPDGSFLFASSDYSSLIQTYAVSGASFTLIKTTNTKSPSPAGLLAYGSQLYSGNAGSNAQTGAYTINKDGSLSELKGSPASDAQGSNSCQVWYDRFDDQVINTEQFSSSFGLYTVTNGVYSFLSHAASTGNAPTQMAQIGHMLFVTNLNSGDVSVYSIYKGKMTFKATITLPVAGSPNGIAAY